MLKDNVEMPSKRKNDTETKATETSDGQPVKKAKGVLPSALPWAANNSAKVDQFISEMETLDNFKVLFGKKEKSDVKYMFSWV